MIYSYFFLPAQIIPALLKPEYGHWLAAYVLNLTLYKRFGVEGDDELKRPHPAAYTLRPAPTYVVDWVVGKHANWMKLFNVTGDVSFNKAMSFKSVVGLNDECF